MRRSPRVGRWRRRLACRERKERHREQGERSQRGPPMIGTSVSVAYAGFSRPKSSVSCSNPIRRHARPGAPRHRKLKVQDGANKRSTLEPDSSTSSVVHASSTWCQWRRHCVPGGWRKNVPPGVIGRGKYSHQLLSGNVTTTVVAADRTGEGRQFR